MRAYFELNDKGHCNAWTAIKGVSRTYTFVRDKITGTSRLSFDGTREEFDKVMRDIYGEMLISKRRNVAIFVYPEIPEPVDTTALEDDNQELRKALAEATDRCTTLETELSEARAKAKPAKPVKPSPFAGGIKPPVSDSITPPPADTKLAPGSASPNPDAESGTPPKTDPPPPKSPPKAKGKKATKSKGNGKKGKKPSPHAV